MDRKEEVFEIWTAKGPKMVYFGCGCRFDREYSSWMKCNDHKERPNTARPEIVVGSGDPGGMDQEKFINKWCHHEDLKTMVRKDLSALLAEAKASGYRDGFSDGLKKATEAIDVGRQVSAAMKAIKEVESEATDGR